MKLRTVLVAASALALLLPATAGSAQTARHSSRGITIGGTGLDSQKLFGATIRWDQRDLRKEGQGNALNVSLVATSGDVGQLVLRRPVTADAQRPKRHYALPLNRFQRKLVRPPPASGWWPARRNNCGEVSTAGHGSAAPGHSPSPSAARAQ